MKEKNKILSLNNFTNKKISPMLKPCITLMLFFFAMNLNAQALDEHETFVQEVMHRFSEMRIATGNLLDRYIGLSEEENEEEII
jgi:hypothetical protein